MKTSAPPTTHPLPPSVAAWTDGSGRGDDGRRRQEGLAALALELFSRRSFEELLQRVTDAARALTNAEMAVSSQTTDGDWAQAVTAVSLSERFARYADFVGTPDGSGIYRLVCERNRPMRLTQAELEAHPAFRGFGSHAAGHPPLQGWLAVPLVGRDGDHLGVIQVSHREAGDFTQEDEDVLMRVAEMAAAVIEDRILRTALEGRVLELDRSLDLFTRLHAERRRLLGQLVTRQEEERERLAHELHDDPVQVMTAVTMRLEIIRKHLSADELPGFERLQHTVTDAVARLRRMMFELRPLALDDSLESALNHYLYVNDLLGCGSVVNGFAKEPPPETRVMLYRIAQEALTHIRKHAAGSCFTVSLGERDRGHLLEVTQEGDVFDVDAGAGDLGVASMRERAELAGGWLSVDVTPGAGSVLRAWIPSDASGRPLGV